MPVLENTIRAVVETLRTEISPAKVYLGGRSMGGRAASMLASKDFDCDGLILLAYPLHPPGAPEKLRDAHLSSIAVPTICFNGTKDPFCTPTLMNTIVSRLGSRFEMHWLDGADHSFHVLKSSGRTDADVLREVGDVTATWLG
jgi:predicted alpha/beta-hydrolase family hydrolase